MNELLAKPEIAGIVVAHGTDTLEETAYFLDLTTISTKPVILVGAQRPASDPDSDGPRNLISPIRVAIASEAVGKGAMELPVPWPPRRSLCRRSALAPHQDNQQQEPRQR